MGSPTCDRTVEATNPGAVAPVDVIACSSGARASEHGSASSSNSQTNVCPRRISMSSPREKPPAPPVLRGLLSTVTAGKSRRTIPTLPSVEELSYTRISSIGRVCAPSADRQALSWWRLLWVTTRAATETPSGGDRRVESTASVRTVHTVRRAANRSTTLSAEAIAMCMSRYRYVPSRPPKCTPVSCRARSRYLCRVRRSIVELTG